MTRQSRRRLARQRKFKLNFKRLLRERREQAILKWDANGDGWLSRDDIQRLLIDLLPKAPPNEEDIDSLMRACGKRDAAAASSASATAPPTRLTAAEALKALSRYDVAVSDVASLVSVASVGSTVKLGATLPEILSLIHI